MAECRSSCLEQRKRGKVIEYNTANRFLFIQIEFHIGFASTISQAYLQHLPSSYCNWAKSYIRYI